MANFFAEALTPVGYFFSGAQSRFFNSLGRVLHPEASSFYDDLTAGGFSPNAHIDVLPRCGLLYVSVPKCASTTIKLLLSRLTLRRQIPPTQLHKRRHSGIKSPAVAGAATLHQLAKDPNALRFSFVRNPYARLVSAWADKFQGKPLLPGDPFIDGYLQHRATNDRSLPAGPSQILTFDQFVRFASATAGLRLDAHWNVQDDLLTMPGIALNFIGKVESFETDIVRVLRHANACEGVCRAIGAPLNASQHCAWQDYYTRERSDIVYRAYERDFDRFGYSRSISGDDTGAF